MVSHTSGNIQLQCKDPSVSHISKQAELQTTSSKNTAATLYAITKVPNCTRCRPSHAEIWGLHQHPSFLGSQSLETLSPPTAHITFQTSKGELPSCTQTLMTSSTAADNPIPRQVQAIHTRCEAERSLNVPLWRALLLNQPKSCQITPTYKKGCVQVTQESMPQ